MTAAFRHLERVLRLPGLSPRIGFGFGIVIEIQLRLPEASRGVVQKETGKAFSMVLLVDEVGSYSGTIPLSVGPSVIHAGADGNRTLLAGWNSPNSAMSNHAC